ncbi:MAG: dockerin type I domain-containing protein [Ruminococcus sp.]
MILLHLCGNTGQQGQDFKAGDVNGDGVVNGMDLALYRQVLSRQSADFRNKAVVR